MRKLFHAASLWGAILLIGAAWQHAARAAESTAAEDAIRRSAKAFVDAFDHGDAEAVAAQWTPDGEYTIGRSSLKGREQIAKIYGEFFRTHPGSKMDVKIESIRVLAPTVAIEQGTASTSKGRAAFEARAITLQST